MAHDPNPDRLAMPAFHIIVDGHPFCHKNRASCNTCDGCILSLFDSKRKVAALRDLFGDSISVRMAEGRCPVATLENGSYDDDVCASLPTGEEEKSNVA